MRCAIDSNILSVLIESASPQLTGKDNKPIAFAKDILDAHLSNNDILLVIPAPVLAEVLMITSIPMDDVNELLAQNQNFIVAPYDSRAAFVNAQVEKPELIQGTKRAGRLQSEAYQKIKIDRQILSCAVVLGCNTIITHDKGMIKDATRYGIGTIGIDEMDVPLSVQQPPLHLVGGSVAKKKK